MTLDPTWEGTVRFYELYWGTWLSYAFLALMWERALFTALAEWKYVLITLLAASAFLINHYFQHAPFYLWLLNGYTLFFIGMYYLIGVHGQPSTVLWKVGAVFSAVVFTIAFILLENISRYLVHQGVHEFWIMLCASFGFAAVILWRGLRRRSAST